MARSEGGKELARSQLPAEGTRVNIGFLATPLHERTAAGNRLARNEQAGPPFIPALVAKAVLYDHPEGWREEVTPAFGRTQVGQLPGDHHAAQERRRVVLCDREIPLTLDEENDPEGVRRLWHDNAGAGITKWTMPARYYNGYELFDTATETRRAGDATITKGHREANDTMRIFYRGAWMGMMIEKLRSQLHETMIIYIYIYIYL